jgi:hypothetical protein
MRFFPTPLLAIWLGLVATPALAQQAAPLQVLNAYIEGNDQCSADLIRWNRKYNARTIAGEVPRVFYYRAIGFQEWGACGRPYFKNIFSELQKIWLIHAAGQVSQAELDTKEAELFDLMFAALAAGDRGAAMVERYEQQTTARLMNLVPEHQFFNCTYFGQQPKCMD